MRLIALFLSMLVSSSAWAGVVYNWQTVSANGYPPTFSGQMVIADAAWNSGVINYSHPRCYDNCHPEGNANPNSPIETFRFDSFSDAFPNRYAPIDVDYVIGTGSRNNPLVGDFNLFLAAIASGSLYVDNAESTLIMSSSGGLWSISSFESDAGPPCRPSLSCAGVTGLWVLDLGTIPVSEPSSLALVSQSFALMFSVYRKRKVADRWLQPTPQA